MNLSRRTILSAPFAMLAARAGAAPPKALRIERVETWKVIVPMRPGTTVSLDFGPTMDVRLRDFDKVPKFIVRLTADNGATGIGETGRGELDRAVARNAEWVRGKDAAALDLGLPNLGLPEGATADAFEMALYDLLGKTVGVRACDLLGGCRQNRVAVTYWTGQRTDADMLNVCRKAAEGGFGHLKFKGRKGDPIDHTVAMVAKEFPKLEMTVDFNQSYRNLSEFLPVAKSLDRGYHLVIEDPIPPNLGEWTQLRQRTSIPYALTTASLAVMADAMKREAVDVFNLGGDMRTFARVCAVAEAGNIPAWHGSGVELGIRDMSFVHAAAATKSCIVPSDTLSYLRESDLVGGAFAPKGGFIDVPRKPGLGVELDEAAVRRFQVRG